MVDEKTAIIHVYGDPLLGDVNRVTNSFHSLYVLLAWQTYPKIEIGEVEFLGPLIQLGASLSDSNEQEVYVPSEVQTEIVASLSTILPELQFSGLKITNSFELNLTGIAEAIDAVAEIADPLRRSERKEKLRAASALNRQQEKVAALAVDSAYMKVMREQMEILNIAADNDFISREEARAAFRAIINQQDAWAGALTYGYVDAIDVVDDPPAIAE